VIQVIYREKMSENKKTSVLVDVSVLDMVLKFFHSPFQHFYISAISIEYMTSHEQGENHEHLRSSRTCKICSSGYCHECHPFFFGICERCGYKILIELVCIMIVISYVTWFGVFG